MKDLNWPAKPKAAGLHWRTKDMTGQRFGRLTVLRPAARTAVASRSQRWEVRCDCGLLACVVGSALRSGETRSCGCLARDVARAAGDRTRTHGMSMTSTHAVWSSMIQRCTNPRTRDYPRYGGRGITVCAAWLKFDGFLADMGVRPEGLTLDRKDNDLGYSPDNCRWATLTEQARNKSVNRLLTHKGITRCLSEWAEVCRINVASFEARLRRGWSVDRAIETPVDRRFSRGQ